MRTARRLAALLVAAVALVAGAQVAAALCAPSAMPCPVLAANPHACCEAPAAISPAMGCCAPPTVSAPAPPPAAAPPQAVVVAAAVTAAATPAPPLAARGEAPRTARLQQRLGLHALHEVFLN